jgi:photosystem II stability/assembly factor-like uncharacterized protein
MRFLPRFSLAAVAALAVLATASAGVNTPQSGWYSGNPLLGPNALRDIACADSTCYAAGEFGTLLKSTDGGSNWKGIVTGLSLYLNRVGLAGGSPDKVIIASDCALRRSDDGGEHFTRLPFTARDVGCPARVEAFSFPTDKVGYVALADGNVLATTDGGRSWSRRTNRAVTDLLCTSPTTCVASWGGGLARTSDGGASWTPVETTPIAMGRLATAGPLTLYAAGTASYISKSTDGGQTWTTHRLDDVPTTHLVDIECGDELHCLMSTTDGPIVRTDDGGVSGTRVSPSDGPAYAVGFASSSRAIAAGALGSAHVSNDAGATWTAVGTRVGGSFTVLAATAPTVAYAGGVTGGLARTGDAGQSWSSVNPPTNATIVSLAGSGPDRVFAYASDGSLERSDNGGQSYSLLNPGTFRPTAIAAIDPSRLLLLGRGLSLSTDAGDSFTPATGKIARAQLNAADLATGAVFVYGASRIFRSSDRGGHWRELAKPKRRAIKDLDFVGPNLGFLLDARGALWKTTNGGGNWNVLPGVGSPAFQVEFSSPLNGYVAIRGGFGSLRIGGVVLRTTDGGRSWHPQRVSSFPLGGLESEGAVDYALAEGNVLYATNVGGDVGAPSNLKIAVRVTSRKKPRHVLLNGRLTPADGGEEIVVSMLQNGSWTHRRLTAASNGTFSARWTIRKTATFVAQVLGDADHRGAGTRPLTVKVR